MAELWDIYDENRNKTGRLHQRGKTLSKGDYHLFVCIWIINSKNQLLLTKRNPNKSWGNYWEGTAGSIVAGEESLVGAIREVFEEIGIRVHSKDSLLLNSERRENSFVDTWLFKKDLIIEDISFQPEEVIDAKWVSKAEYEDMCNSGLIVPTVRNFYEFYPCKA
jgi:8-oxo-dGTP pyrophosphatase MutT (NUDIX family)